MSRIAICGHTGAIALAMGVCEMILVHANAGPEPTPGPRRLVLVDADMVEAHGTDFVASRWLFEGLLNLVDNKTHNYITSVSVTAQEAHALADAIAAVPVTPALAVAWAIHGDGTGDGVKALERFLRAGDVLLVDGDSISA